MNRSVAPTFTAAIYIAGDLAAARDACRRYCMAGLCVTVEPVEFIYTGGAETGVRVGLINYPRFPAEAAATRAKALDLAEVLIAALCQWSASVVMADETVWLSRRPEGTPPPSARLGAGGSIQTLEARQTLPSGDQ